MTFLSSLYAEFVKFRRSRISWVLPLLFGIGPVVAVLFMLVLMNPGIGSRLGLLAAKARLAATSADWQSYLGMIGQMLGLGGMIIIGLMATYVFGREYADGTAKIILTLPVRRSVLVATKLIVCLGWYVLSAVWIFGLALVLGHAVGLPGYYPALLHRAMQQALRLVLETLLLASVPAWVAIAAKGYFVPLGITILALVLGSAVGATGWGQWFPWSIVPLDSGMAGPDVPLPGIGSKVVLAGVFLAGWYLAWRSLDRADNLQ